MRFRKVPTIVSLFMVCFVLAAQSAKADDIIFTDLGDTISVTGTGRFLGLSASCTVGIAAELCSVTISAPTTGTYFGSTSLPNQLNIFGSSLSALGITEPGTSTLSDALVIGHLVGSTTTTVTFLSDPPATAGVEAPLGICNQNFLGISIPCNIPETGVMQLAGTINWTTGVGGSVTPDHVYFLSDVTPEPASLILFGSGLVVAGGFLRRRRRPLTPSAAA